MTVQGIVILNLIALAFLLWVANLVRRGDLYAGYGVIFISLTVFMMITLSVPKLLSLVVGLVGAVLPASALTLLALGFIVFMLIYILTQLTMLSNRLTVLVQGLAIQQARKHVEGSFEKGSSNAPQDHEG
ncbi:MAG: DUF2304 domain-containing protein [Acidobacteriota bacterium]